MKIKIWMLAFFVLFIFAAVPAQAHYVWFDPSGEVGAVPGETVTVDVYLHADTDDTLVGWGLNVGFDDAAIDGDELTYLSYTYGNETLAAHGTDEAIGYLQGLSEYSPGDSLVHAGRYDWTLTGYGLTAADDLLLFSVEFTFVSGIWDGEDVWAEFIDGNELGNWSYFDMASGYYDNGVYGGLDISVQEGPDYAAVPIPGAVLLFGSGLLGLIGIRRRKD